LKNLLLSLVLFFAASMSPLTQAAGTWTDNDYSEIDRLLKLAPVTQGESKYSPDMRYVYQASRDGWITKTNVLNPSSVATVRAGLAVDALAVSSDGQWILVACADPHTLVLLDADLQLVRSYPVMATDGKSSSRISTVHDAQARKSFIVGFVDIPEIWEISYNPQAEPIYDGLVHDYRNGEGLARPGFLGAKRMLLEEPMADLFFDPNGSFLVGVIQPKETTAPNVQVFNLDIRRRIAFLTLTGTPHPGSAGTFDWNGTMVIAIPNLMDRDVNLIDLKSWKFLQSIHWP